ncbi:hypothetical protein QVD17_15066 [Tagetes erecta]|uniref:Polyprotein n=1 Tax=Tagetes erecta TaxID=13708 RepID=A0AAD8KNK6_TARER|nr:hypothetical protein QVD17_15066 [Tagetes erecta]
MGKKALPVLMINDGRCKKRHHPEPKAKVAKGKGQVKGKFKGKAKAEPPKPKDKKLKVSSQDPCFGCGEIGHWKRNCPTYLKELKAKRDAEQTSGTTFMIHIDLDIISSNTWVLDTGCGTHIGNLLQGFKRSKLYKKGDTSLYMGDGAKVVVEALGDYVLKPPTMPSNGIYELVHEHTSFDNSLYQSSTKKLKVDLSKTYLWHCRLGQINKGRIHILQKNGLLKTNEGDSFDKCESCLLGRMTKKPFSGTNERAKDLLGIIHTDVCGSFKTMTRNGERYFITFIDDYSRYGYVYLLRHKDEAFEMFKVFQDEVQNQLKRTIEVLRSDRGGEYLNDAFQEHLRSCAIISQLTPPGTPQHNGVSERKNRTLLDMVRSMMARSTLPLSFWVFALLSAAHIVNMDRTKKVDKTPFEICNGRVPSLSYLKVWGGTSRTVELDEDRDPQADTRLVETSIQQGVVENDQMGDQDTHNVRRSGRNSNPPERYGFFMNGFYVVDSDEPTTYRDAIAQSDCDKWLEAMNVEMQSMHDNQAWDLVEPPLNSKPVGSKWVFKKKNRYAWKLGYLQSKACSKRILFAIAAYYDYEIWQIDVKTAFLNGHLEEDVYMIQPEGFANSQYPNKVCKLKKSIYGLKQASRMGASSLLYVDDILLYGNDIPTMQSVKTWLGSRFSIKDLGEAAYILGIKIYRDRSRRLIGLNQSAYIDKILKRFKMENSKKGLVPIPRGTILSASQCPSSKDEQEKMKGIPYASGYRIHHVCNDMHQTGRVMRFEHDK